MLRVLSSRTVGCLEIDYLLECRGFLCESFFFFLNVPYASRKLLIAAVFNYHIAFLHSTIAVLRSS